MINDIIVNREKARKRTIELRGFNLGKTKIRRILLDEGFDVPEGTIQSWYQFGRNAGAPRFKKTIPDSARELTSEKAYVLGVLGCGDGSIEKTRELYCILSLSVTDMDFALEFKRCIEKVYGLEATLRPAWGTKKRRHRVRLCSVEATRDILKYASLEHFRHHTERVPEVIKRVPLEIKAAYVRGIFDSQGSVSNQITITKSSRRAIEDIKEILESFGLSVFAQKMLPGRGHFGGEVWQLRIHEIASMVKFAHLVSSNIARKRSRLGRIARRGYVRFNQFKYKKLIDGVVPKMVELRSAGLTHQQIADCLGLCRETIIRRLNAFSGETQKVRG